MKIKANQTQWELRKILGLTQAEFAAMIGASKDTVASWDAGRNPLSAAFARRIAFATGVDEDSLLEGKGPPTLTFPVVGARGYTADDFARYRGTTKGRSDEAGARHHLKNCEDTLELIFLAAAGSVGGERRHGLPGVLHSFIEWSEGVRRDFELGQQIDAQLEGRKAKAGVTLSYTEWRRLEREDPARARAAGFKDDPRKGGEEELRLEVEVRPGWAPGRRMRLPNASTTEVVVPQGKRERGAEGRRDDGTTGLPE
jgi:DNA-binding XRE family transcriptional regulator